MGRKILILHQVVWGDEGKVFDDYALVLAKKKTKIQIILEFNSNRLYIRINLPLPLNLIHNLCVVG